MSQLIQMYLNCDARFFRQGATYGIYSSSPKHVFNCLFQTEGEIINKIILNTAQPEELEITAYDRLRELVALEERQIINLSVAPERKFSIDSIMRSEEIISRGKADRYTIGRIERHLFRLWDPDAYNPEVGTSGISSFKDARRTLQNKFCRNFVRDYIHYAAQSTEPKEADRLQGIIGDEGEGTLLFWTFAPYIHQGLQERNISSEESMRKIIQWVNDAWEKVSKSLPQKGHYNYFAHANFTKLGLHGKLDEGIQLGFDERMPSHLHARLLAKAIAREL